MEYKIKLYDSEAKVLYSFGSQNVENRKMGLESIVIYVTPPAFETKNMNDSLRVFKKILKAKYGEDDLGNDAIPAY